ncbi:MAG: carbohydrate kinase family protein [Chloroflexi bacterium]|nr:MAG: carbohydrate kinase family protein [Chloroflexota bacterium]
MTNDTQQPILSIGDLVADLVVAVPHLPVEAGQHQLARDIRLEPGGAANFLIAGARLGAVMAAVGGLGRDPWGHLVADILRQEQVDLSGVQFSGTTTLVVVLVGPDGEHVFLGRYGQGDPLALRPEDIQQIQNCAALYTAGYALAEDRLAALTLQALRLARQSGRPVYFDPGPQFGAVPADIQTQILPLVDTLLLTADELALFPHPHPADLLRHGPRLVVVKQGAGGCTLYSPQKPEGDHFPGYPVPVRDTSAAGDSFNAAFIAAASRGLPPADCARLANAVGAAKVQKLGGGRNVPTRAEVQAVLDRFGIEIEIGD